jgi:HK97 gp10 family phage protein
MDNLEIRVQFDLVIEEADDEVSDQTLGDIQQEARIILEEGGESMAETAREYAPFRTGRLMASIYYRVEDVSGLALGANVAYAPYVEYGNSRSPPHPFLQTAINEHQPVIQEDLDLMIAEHLAEDSSTDNPEFELSRETVAEE